VWPLLEVVICCMVCLQQGKASCVNSNQIKLEAFLRIFS